jgi:hypothetical protein
MLEQTFKIIDCILQKDAGCGSIGLQCKVFEYLKDSNSKAVSGTVPGVPQVSWKNNE